MYNGMKNALLLIICMITIPGCLRNTSTPQTYPVEAVVTTTSIEFKPVTTSTASQVVTSTTAVVCPTLTTVIYRDTECPEFSLPQSINKSLLNMRWDKPTSECAQYGYKTAKTDCLGIMGLAKTFNEQVVHDVTKPIEGIRINESEDFYCFSKGSGSDYGLYGLAHNRGFLLDEMLWNATQVNSTWLVWNITTIWNSTINQTVEIPNSYIEINVSNSLWVQRI
jgi:hypothetical protein